MDLRRRPSLVLALVVFVPLAIAACGGDAAQAPGAPSASGTAAASPTAPATGSPSPPAPSPTAVPGTPLPPVATLPSLTISAVGDISLAREVVDRMEAQGPGYPYALIAPLLTGDIVIANLEGALTDRGEPWPKGYNFRTPPRFASGLRDAGFDVVSLANNHTLDFGALGLLDTVDALGLVGVRPVGAGADAATAYAPAIVEAGGLRVAFLGYVATPDEGGGFSIREWIAGTGAPGVAFAGEDEIAAGVAAARAQADFVVVMVHAGTEYVNVPDATQRRLAGAVLAAGADAYIGAHAHVVQPVEQRGGQLIAWGLGNFIFDLDPVDLANIPEPRVSLVLNFTLTKGAGVTAWDAVAVTQDAAEDRPRPATAAETDVLRRLLVP